MSCIIRGGKKTIKNLVTVFLVAILGCCSALAYQESFQSVDPPEESLSEWSKMWLEEVVPYIITSKEKEYFLSLSSEEERGEFIARFWKVRDPDQSTPENEYKDEHYKRIAIANNLFGASGIAGWRTARGKVFVMLGPPHQIQTDMKAAGAAEQRRARRRHTQREAHLYGIHGGKEIWIYNGIANSRTPYSMEFVFVDKFDTGNYQLERSVKMGDAGRNPETLTIDSMRYEYDYLENIKEAMEKPLEREDALKGEVTTKVTYEHIPLSSELFHLKNSEENNYSTFLTVEIPYPVLTSSILDDKHSFSLEATASARNDKGEIVFEETQNITFDRTVTEYLALKDKAHKLQIPITFEPGAYEIELVIMDTNSGKVGLLKEAIDLPSFTRQDLAMSDIFLSSVESELSDDEDTDTEVTDLRVFQPGEELDVIFEVYNLSIDEDTGFPDFKAEYMFYEGGKLLTRISAPIEMLKDRKDYLVSTTLRLKQFKPGVYALRVRVFDSVSGKVVMKEIKFVVV